MAIYLADDERDFIIYLLEAYNKGVGNYGAQALENSLKRHKTIALSDAHQRIYYDVSANSLYVPVAPKSVIGRHQRRGRY